MSRGVRPVWDANFDKQPSIHVRAPGRINLIGEHTDYNLGYVLPAAIDRSIEGMFRLAYGSSRLISERSGEAPPFIIGKRAQGSWSKYAAACALALIDQGLTPAPIEGAISSTLPGSSGLSSSAALELCLLTAWNSLCEFGLKPRELAEIAWRAENEYVGVKCGKMDQLAVALGEPGAALFIDTRDGSVEPVVIPSDLQLVVLDTRRPRSLAGAAYNQRVEECAEAAVKMSVETLRDATLADLDYLDGTPLKRARHVITENQRVLDFRKALGAEDRQSLFDLAQASHLSLRYDYEVSCPELDAMAEATWSAPGCVAGRLTGAGFGGCCVALVDRSAYPGFADAVRGRYSGQGFAEPSIFPVEPTAGTSVMYL